jgi:hypothetical protein
MNLAKEFRNNASESRRMATDTRDLESKAEWNGLAERWERLAASQEMPARHSGRASRSDRKHPPKYRQAS